MDRYRLSASTTSIAFAETPWAWLATGPGYSAANPNNAQPWQSESVSPTSASLQTFFYYIRTNNLGQTVNRWVPFNPHNAYNSQTFRFEMTLNGRAGTPPLTASISGPDVVSTGYNNTWYANASGGTGAYTYRWFRDGMDTNVTTPDYTTATFAPMSLSVNVSDGPSGTTAYMAVSVIEECSPKRPCARVAPGEAAPAVTAFHAPAPNPASAGAGPVALAFDLASPARVTLVVYDMLGREVARPADGEFSAGWHRAVLDGAALQSGVYVARFSADGEGGPFVQTQRLTLVR